MSLFDALLEDDLIAPPLVGGSPAVAAREIWICLRTDGAIGSGTRTDPFDGSSHEKFDAAMLAAAVGARICIGPGTFETKGSNAGGWTAKRGEVVGSGTYATTLKLVEASEKDQGYAIILGGPINGFEISDLTLDCNIAGQANSSGLEYAAVCVSGMVVRVQI